MWSRAGRDRRCEGRQCDEEDKGDWGPVGADMGWGVHVPSDGSGAGPPEGRGPGVRHVGEARLRGADSLAGMGAEAGHPCCAPARSQGCQVQVRQAPHAIWFCVAEPSRHSDSASSFFSLLVWIECITPFLPSSTYMCMYVLIFVGIKVVWNGMEGRSRTVFKLQLLDLYGWFSFTCWHIVCLFTLLEIDLYMSLIYSSFSYWLRDRLANVFESLYHGYMNMIRRTRLFESPWPPICVWFVQRLTRCMSDIICFISKLAERELPLFKLLQSTGLF